MNWTLTSSDSALVHEFHLIADTAENLVVKINPLHQSVRLQSGGRRRLIFIDAASEASGRFRLHDEYGMEVGNMLFDKWYNNRGYVTLDGSKYFFQQLNNSLAQLVIYQADIQHPLLTCELPTNAEPPSFHQKATEADNHCILLSLCWLLLIASGNSIAEKQLLQQA